MKLSAIGEDFFIPTMKGTRNYICHVNTHTIYSAWAGHEQSNILVHKFHF